MKRSFPNLECFLLILLSPFGGASGQKAPPLSFSLGKEVQVCEPPNGGNLQCEPSVAIHENVIVVSWNDSYGGKMGAYAGAAVGWAVSRDNGKSFRFGGFLSQSGEKPKLKVDGSDSWVGADASGNFYLQVLRGNGNKLFVYYMDHRNLGRWKKKHVAFSGRSPAETCDKPCMDITPPGKINLSFSYCPPTGPIAFIRSPDKGETWSKPIKVSLSTKKVRTGSSVASHGNKILVTWVEGDLIRQCEIWYAFSTDNGKTFSKPRLLYKEKKLFSFAKG